MAGMQRKIRWRRVWRKAVPLELLVLGQTYRVLRRDWGPDLAFTRRQAWSMAWLDARTCRR